LGGKRLLPERRERSAQRAYKSDATLLALMPKTAVGRKSKLLEGKPPSAYVERPLVFEASVTKNGCDSSGFPQQARPQEFRCRADIGR
jgi:hypothetical protein